MTTVIRKTDTLPTAGSQPDYIAELLDLVERAETTDDLDMIWESAKRVVTDSYRGRHRIKVLRRDLLTRGIVLGDF